MDENLTTEQLAARWNMDPKTIARWRKIGKGPKYVKLGEGKTSPVFYRVSDVEEYERQHLSGGQNDTPHISTEG